MDGSPALQHHSITILPELSPRLSAASKLAGGESDEGSSKSDQERVKNH